MSNVPNLVVDTGEGVAQQSAIESGPTPLNAVSALVVSKPTEQKSDSGPQYADEFTVALFGAGACGKTSLIVNFLNAAAFSEDYDPTIEDEYRNVLAVDGRSALLHLSDFSGQPQFSSLIPQWIQRTVDATGDGVAFAFVFDVSDERSFQKVDDFIEQTKAQCEECGETLVALLVANKCDIKNGRKVAKDTGKGKALQQLGSEDLYIETSAKASSNVTLLFETAVRLMRKQRSSKEVSQNKDDGPCCVLL